MLAVLGDMDEVAALLEPELGPLPDALVEEVCKSPGEVPVPDGVSTPTKLPVRGPGAAVAEAPTPLRAPVGTAMDGAFEAADRKDCQLSVPKPLGLMALHRVQ